MNKVLRIKAMVRLKRVDDDGRATPVGHRYMPNIKVNDTDGYAGFMLGPDHTMSPGTMAEIELAIVGTSEFLEILQEGQSFSIYEGIKEVGDGIVKTIIEGPMNRLILGF